MKYFHILIIFSLFILSQCSQAQSNDSEEGELVFQSGFEPECMIIPHGSDADIIGRDLSLSEKNDWIKDLDENPLVGSFNIQYQGGDSTQRFAKIVREPGNAENHVLWFWLNDPNVDGKKGRIQGNIYGGKIGLKEFSQSIKIFLHEDFEMVRTFPEKIHWLTIAEFWNNITWSSKVPYGFRITLGLGKPVRGESNLYFILDAQDCKLFDDGSQEYTTLWSETNTNVNVPIGEWFTLNYYFKEGNAQTGRFRVTFQLENGKKEVIFDVTNFTHNSHDPNPDGITDFNPFKLYTSKELIGYMKNKGKTLQIYWDDFKLWKDKRP